MPINVEVHRPVLTEEVLKYLNVRPRRFYVDATLNGGGHTRRILKSGGRVLGIERDTALVRELKNENLPHLIVEEGNYQSMNRFLKKHKVKQVDGILFDFGMSSWHLDKSGRGFAILKDEPLDMRYSPKEKIPTAAHIINSSTTKELESIFSSYGEVRNARKVAEVIVKERKTGRIVTTKRLREIIERISPWREKIHPATKIFQALRIAVNRELEAVSRGIKTACSLIRPGGRVVAISYHSLEDRIVKRGFKDAGGRVLTKKPVRSSITEIRINPRSRSARLRAWERT